MTCRPFRWTRRLAGAALLGLAGVSLAQVPEVPASLSGRWTWVDRSISQTFALDDIKVQPDQTFAAKFTWWTNESRCALRGEPIVGKLTATGLSFDAKTKCDVAFTVVLSPASSGWAGTASTSGDALVLQLKAN